MLAPAVNGAVTALTQRSYSRTGVQSYETATGTNIRGSNAACPAAVIVAPFVSANKKDTTDCHVVSPIKTRSAYKEHN